MTQAVLPAQASHPSRIQQGIMYEQQLRKTKSRKEALKRSKTINPASKGSKLLHILQEHAGWYWVKQSSRRINQPESQQASQQDLIVRFEETVSASIWENENQKGTPAQCSCMSSDPPMYGCKCLLIANTQRFTQPSPSADIGNLM
jgi:hypothetical protein